MEVTDDVPEFVDFSRPGFVSRYGRVNPAPVWSTSSPVTIGSLELGAQDSNGTRWKITGFTGWGSTGPTLAPEQKARQSGTTSGDSFSQGRTVTISGMILSQNPAQHSLDCDALIAAVSKEPTMMQVSESGRVRWCVVRRSAEVEWQRKTNFISSYTFQVHADDWRKFGTPLTGVTALPSSIGGMTYPMTYPYLYGATSVSGQVSLVNPGNEFGPVVLRIDGPCVGPTVTHVSSGEQLVFASSLVLGAGEFLLVDMEAHTVLANGQASRQKWVTKRGWSSFQPGPNTWSFDAITYNAASQLTITAIPADE